MTTPVDVRWLTRDVPTDACACPPVGHRVLQAAFEHVEAACDKHVPDAAPAVARLRQHGLVQATIGAEGGWPREDMWTATLTAAGREHIAQVLGVADVHAAGGGCGGRWDADQRCASCGTYRPLTDQLARARLLSMAAGPERDMEVWASGFACERHGRGRTAMVRTDKTCAWCGEGLLRLGGAAVTDAELTESGAGRPGIREAAMELVRDLNDYEAHRHLDQHDLAACRQHCGHDPWTDVILRGQGYRLAVGAEDDPNNFIIEAAGGPGHAEITRTDREDGPGSRWEVRELFDPTGDRTRI